MAIDYDKEFERFTMGSDSSAIKDIYTIIPSLDQEQMQIVQSLLFYTKKYSLFDLEIYISSYLQYMKENKNLNFLKSQQVKSLLRSYTMEEMLKGVKIQNRQPQD